MVQLKKKWVIKDFFWKFSRRFTVLYSFKAFFKITSNWIWETKSRVEVFVGWKADFSFKNLEQLLKTSMLYFNCPSFEFLSLKIPHKNEFKILLPHKQWRVASIAYLLQTKKKSNQKLLVSILHFCREILSNQKKLSIQASSFISPLSNGNKILLRLKTLFKCIIFWYDDILCSFRFFVLPGIKIKYH